MRALQDSFAVAAGAAIGANARYWLGTWLIGKVHPVFPFHTLAINVLGSLVLGAFMAAAMTHGWSHGWRLVVAVGVCGGFTTFSAYSAEVVTLMEEGRLGMAAAYFFGSSTLCVAACFLGAHFARMWLPPVHP